MAGYDSVQARREAESLRVDSRTKQIHSLAELDAAFTLAGDKLIMLAIESEEECMMSDDLWDRNNVAGTETNKEQCRQLSASLARIAREADNVVFLRVEVLESGDTRQIAKELNITKFPTYQYWKNDDLMWQHVGAGAGVAAELSEGVLYYGGQGAAGLNVRDYVTEINSRNDLGNFIESCAAPTGPLPGFDAGLDVPCDKQLAIVDIGVDKDAPHGCLHIFPAVLSLARNTQGFTRWARMAIDKNAETADIAREFGIDTVPSFVFMADGKVVDRYSGSDRVELMNHVLAFQKANGIRLPERGAKRRMSTAEAKEIARAARDRAKAEGRQTGW